MTGLWCQWCWLQQVIIAAIISAFPWNDNSRACLKKYQSPEEQFFLSQLSHFMADQLRERNTCSLKIRNSLTSLTFLTLLVDVCSWCKKYFLYPNVYPSVYPPSPSQIPRPTWEVFSPGTWLQTPLPVPGPSQCALPFSVEEWVGWLASVSSSLQGAI